LPVLLVHGEQGGAYGVDIGGIGAGVGGLLEFLEARA
jgi:hypothetical protein